MAVWIPGELKQIQAIVKFVQDPCEAPWTLYLELARAPAKKLIIELLTFGLDDVYRGFVRPKGIYSFKRTGRRRGKRGGVKGIPELGELLGHNLPGAETMHARPFGNGTRWLWLIDGALQRVLFWWMIVDITTDFLFEWTTLIGKTEYCHGDRLTGAASCDVALGVINYLLPAEPLGCEYLHKSWGTVAGMSPMTVEAPCSVFSASVTAKALPTQNFGTLSIWIARLTDPATPLGNVDGQQQDWLTREATATCSADLPGPGIYAAFAHVTGPNIAFITGGLLSGWAWT